MLKKIFCEVIFYVVKAMIIVSALANTLYILITNTGVCTSIKESFTMAIMAALMLVAAITVAWVDYDWFFDESLSEDED